MKRPFAWSRRWHAVFRDLCVRRWGIETGDAESATLVGVLERAYGASDARSLSELARRLRDLPDSDPEVQAFVALLVVGETSFFRNRPQFDALERSVLPEMIARRRAEGSLRLRVWSAGCSTGEEPYSIAMLLDELLPDLNRWQVSILGTDINPQALRRAADALYTDWSFREADPARMRKYFSDAQSLRRFDHPCRSLVRFAQLNLSNATFPSATLGADPFDLILCRNVMIYFRREIATRAVDLFLRALAPGGWLAVGHAEPEPKLFAKFDEIEFPDTFMYRRPEAPEGGPRAPAAQSLPPPRPAVRTAAPPRGVDRRRARALEAIASYHPEAPERSAARLEVLSDRFQDEPTAPHLLAQLAADARRFDDALFWALTALQRDALHVPTLLLVGLIHLERDEPERAKRSFRQALFLDPNAPEAHLFLSIALRTLGDERVAERHRARASALAATAGIDDLLPVQRARLSLRED